MSNPTNPTDALKAERLAAFINLAQTSPKTVAGILANVIDALEQEVSEANALRTKGTQLREELEARTAEFEEKYYGLDLQNRALEKHQKFLKGRIADQTRLLANAQALLKAAGTPLNFAKYYLGDA